MNDSRHNTGLRVPPAVEQPRFRHTCQNRTPCTGGYLESPADHV